MCSRATTSIPLAVLGNLLMLLYEEGMPQAHASVAWLFWRYLGDNPQSRSVEWPKIRAVWEWRLRRLLTQAIPQNTETR